MRYRLHTSAGAILVVSYLVTWAGGWRAHSREMASRATYLYQRVESEKARFLEWQREGLVAADEVYSTELLPGGPKSIVNWCLPILPAVLLADSEYVVGPLYGSGSAKIVLYTGAGSVTLLELWGWRS